MYVPWWAVAAVIFGALLAVALLAAGKWLSPIARRELVRAVERSYGGRVELGSLKISLFPSPRAAGERFVLRADNPDVPPLITLRRFEGELGWSALIRSPRRIRRMRLEGLDIVIARGRRDAQEVRPERPEPTPFVIGEVLADGTRLQILPKTPGKEPLIYDIYQLTLSPAAPDRPMRYRAELRNAKPPGLIHAKGEFGPWQSADPGQTPVTGTYSFANADLAAFRGLAGKLSSTGEFRGVLERLAVNGQTDTPDFTVRAGNHPVHLKTTFSATVDGTNGDTLLHPVVARFGETTVTAEGGVKGTAGVRGKTVALHATVRDGNLADILRFGVKGEPPMTGRVSFHSKLEIPPGEQDIVEKLRLDGELEIGSGKFTKSTLQDKIAGLSARAQGEPGSAGSRDETASNIRGAFRLDTGILTLYGFSFKIPGAAIQLNGTYGLLTERLDFRGTATTEAKPSEMTTGVKSFLLKALDPLLHKDHRGTVIPIRISGIRSDPSFGLSLLRK